MILLPFRVNRSGMDVVVTLQVFDEDGKKVCGIFSLEGSIPLGPKAWLKAVRSELGIIEGIARDAGCAEMRLAGRNWSNILPGYSPLAGFPNGLRKAL